MLSVESWEQVHDFFFFFFFSCDTDLSTQSLNAVMVLCCVCVVREKNHDTAAGNVKLCVCERS